MKAVFYHHFCQKPVIEELPDPTVSTDSVVVKVMASGVCRSDWHGWQGHDSDISLPHVPGHEFAGKIVEVGGNITRWKVGDRVTVPFVGGCGGCPQCYSGNQQVCDHQFQPGFTHWGSFAEYVEVQYAEANLVRLPDDMDYTTAASLGCRFVTAFRAIVDQGKVCAGQWVAIYGCGGVGLSAIMIANALGARVIGVDIDQEKLNFAAKLGATALVNASDDVDVVTKIKTLSGGGVDVSLDALGSAQTCVNSISCLAKRGKHIQVGLLVGEQSSPSVPMGLVLSNELELIGSHGMQAHRYPPMLNMIQLGKLMPQKLVGQKISLAQSVDVLVNMDQFNGHGVTVITEF